MTKCSVCGAEWGGYLTCHCSVCHLTFTGVSNFDKHRTGSHVKSTRTCVPAPSVGLVDAGRSYECWANPKENRSRVDE